MVNKWQRKRGKWSWRRRRIYKNIASYEYLKVKLEYNDVIKFAGNVAGPAFFKSQGAQGVPNFVSTDRLLNGTHYWATLASLFAYYRVFGVSIEIMPSPSNTNGSVVISNIDPVYVAYNPGSSQVMSLPSIRSFNGCLMLDPTSRQRKYTTLYGGTADYKATTDTTAGGLTVRSTSDGKDSDSPLWTIKLVLYVILKRSRI